MEKHSAMPSLKEREYRFASGAAAASERPAGGPAGVTCGSGAVGVGVGEKDIVGATVGAGLGGGLQPLHEIATSSECPQL